MATKDISDIEVIKAQFDYLQNRCNGYGYKILSKRTSQCEKVCYYAMMRAHKRGFLEYGTSLKNAWITEKGMKLLNETK